MKILHVIGARPNYMKIAPIVREMAKYPNEFDQILVHTGQHYDANMSQVFFDELDMPKPDINLDVGSGTHAWQTAQIMQRFEPVLLEFKPDWVLVPGDVNSTIACALVAAKLGVRIAHVEAGLRSFDRTMPEEVNRLLTDQISDLLLTPSRDADQNLLREGIAQEKICFVGNIMIDTLVRLLPKAQERWRGLCAQFALNERYILVTLHRPSNVDDVTVLCNILEALAKAAERTTVLFPIHPRTRRRIIEADFNIVSKGMRLIEPLGYLDFLALQAHAALILTDSGGIQEETTYMGVPCLTVRPNTERPITIHQGTNHLVESRTDALVRAIEEELNGSRQLAIREVPEYWDGQTAARILDVLKTIRARARFIPE